MRNLGQTIGISVSGILLSETLFGIELAMSLHQVFWILTGIALIALMLSGLLIGKKLEQPEKGS